MGFWRYVMKRLFVKKYEAIALFNLSGWQTGEPVLERGSIEWEISYAR